MKTKKMRFIQVPLLAVAFLVICSVASAQNLFVGSYYTGDNITEIPTSGSPSVFATGYGYPTGLAFDSSGDLFASDQQNGYINEYKNSGGTLSTTPATFATGLTQPNIMAFDRTGDLFVDVNGSAIYEYTNGGGRGTFLTTVNGASGLAFNSAGDLFVAFINGGGSTSGFINEYLPGGTQKTFASGLNYPVGLTFDGAGNLLVAEGNGADAITTITPGGTESLYASGLDQPTSIAFNNAGDMFVADQGVGGDNGDITEFTPTGQKIIYNTSITKPTALAFQGMALPVPEPSTLALLGLGTLAALARFKNKKSSR